VAYVSSMVLHHPMVVARIIDRVTGRDTSVQSAVVAAERSDETVEWPVLREWQALHRLHELVGNVEALHRSCALPKEPKEPIEVQVALGAALHVIEREVPNLKTGFRESVVESMAPAKVRQ
jgi:hypothetical protein